MCAAVMQGLAFADGYVPDLNDAVLYQADVDVAALRRKLHRRMRTELPVPAIYTTLMVLRRLLEFAEAQRDALEAETVLRLPSCKTSVDLTVKNIFRRWVERVARFSHEQADFRDLGWNPWTGIVQVMREVVDHNASVFFGL